MLYGFAFPHEEKMIKVDWKNVRVDVPRKKTQKKTTAKERMKEQEATTKVDDPRLLPVRNHIGHATYVGAEEGVSDLRDSRTWPQLRRGLDDSTGPSAPPSERGLPIPLSTPGHCQKTERQELRESAVQSAGPPQFEPYWYSEMPLTRQEDGWTTQVDLCRNPAGIRSTSSETHTGGTGREVVCVDLFGDVKRNSQGCRKAPVLTGRGDKLECAMKAADEAKKMMSQRTTTKT